MTSDLMLYLGGPGIVGLVTYVYLCGSAVSFSTNFPVPVTKPRPEKSAPDPGRFLHLNLKQKAVELYNHNALCSAFEFPGRSAVPQ
jgi:hypothetical protein